MQGSLRYLVEESAVPLFRSLERKDGKYFGLDGCHCVPIVDSGRYYAWIVLMILFFYHGDRLVNESHHDPHSKKARPQPHFNSAPL
jgi:hypothetical protein